MATEKNETASTAVATQGQQNLDVLPTDAGTRRLAKFDLLDLDSSLLAAKQLADFIKKAKLSSDIKGKQYVRVEGWQFMFRLANFSYILDEPVRINEGSTMTRYLGGGANAKTVEVPIYAYKCRCTVVDLSTGQVVGYGYAMCSNEEDAHKSYEPYAIYSYAQTRAISKAGRNMFAFLVAAAGYEPTPAEEMEFETANVVGTKLNTDSGAVPPPPAAIEQGIAPVAALPTPNAANLVGSLPGAPEALPAPPPAIPDVPADVPVAEATKAPRKTRAPKVETATPPPAPAADELPEPEVAAAEDETPPPPPPAPVKTAAPATPAAPAAAGTTALTDDIIDRMIESVEKKGKKGFDNINNRLPLYTYTPEQYKKLQDGVAKFSFLLPNLA